MRLSLKTQIFLWYALVMPVIILGLSFTTQTVSIDGLRASMDYRLQDRAAVVANAILLSPRMRARGYENLVQRVTEQQFRYVPAVLRISEPGGNILVSFGEIPEPLVGALSEQLSHPQLGQGRFETIQMRGRDAIRLYTMPVYDPATREVIAFVQTGDSLASIAAAQEQLWQYALLVGVGGSAVALLFGLLILHHGFSPLDRILGRIREIRGKNLNIRIPDERRPQELQHLADTLNDVFQQLDTAFRTREAFVAGVSHDLRTPLTVLQGQVDVLLMDPATSTEARDRLATMGKEIRRLTRMTNNLLLNAQLESHPVFTAGNVDLKELVEEAAREMQTVAQGVQLTVNARDIVVVPGDYDMIKQMVLNVLDNAVKYSPQGSKVGLVLSSDDASGVITISDTGPGIPPQALARIGTPFYRVDAGRQPHRGGAGMGLAIARQVARIHNGEVRFSSQEGLGTTVTLVLPLGAQI